MNISFKTVAELFGETTNWEQDITGVSIDSRTINLGELFVAIKGENFDGHDFALQAYEASAACVIVEKHIDKIPAYRQIVVKNTVKALARLAKFYKKCLSNLKGVIGITGSNGKTSTKEMLIKLLSKKFKVGGTRGNFNNHIGLPLSLLKLKPDTEYAVFELGMSAKGEIDYLAGLLEPDYAIITTVSEAHTEFFSSLEDIVKAKAEIIGHAKKGIVIPDDQPLLNKIADDFKGEKLTFGFNKKSDVFIKNYELHGFYSKVNLKVKDKIYTYKLSLPGIGNVKNSAAIAGILHLLNMDLAEYLPVFAEEFDIKGRMKKINLKNGAVLIDDSYNANPESMKNAFYTLKSFKNKRLTAVIGTMYELGELTLSAHVKLGELAAESGVDRVFVISEYSDMILKGFNSIGSKGEIKAFENNKEVAEYILNTLKSEDVILIKGSRRCKLEEVVNEIVKLYF